MENLVAESMTFLDSPKVPEPCLIVRISIGIAVIAVYARGSEQSRDRGTLWLGSGYTITYDSLPQIASRTPVSPR